MIAKYNNSNLLAIKNHPDFSDKFKMYPNPVESMLHISSYTQEQINSIQILVATGKVIIKETDNTESINVQNLPGGIYFLKIFQPQFDLYFQNYKKIMDVHGCKM